MRFSDLYSLAQFAEAANLSWFRGNDWPPSSSLRNSNEYAEACAADARDKKLLNDHKKDQFKPAMLAWLEHLRDTGRLNKLTGLRGREAALPEAWNAFLDKSIKDHDLTYLIDHFNRFLIHYIIRVDENRYSRRKAEDFVPGLHIQPSEAQIQTAYDNLIATVEAGNSDYIFFLDDIQDSKTGDRLKIEFVNWTATLMKRGAPADNYEYIVAEDALEIPMQTIEIDLPTGELLISDWVRVPGFREATDLGYADPTLNISNQQGAVNTTKAHAARHGFATVQTTNTSVIVHQDGAERILVSERWDPETEEDLIIDGMSAVGDFSCDLWWATAIDRQTLEALMAKGGCETPAQTLDKHLADDDNIVKLQVSPGRWRIHFGPNFAEQADRNALGIPEGPEPWLLLEPVKP